MKLGQKNVPMRDSCVEWQLYGHVAGWVGSSYYCGPHTDSWVEGGVVAVKNVMLMTCCYRKGKHSRPAQM